MAVRGKKVRDQGMGRWAMRRALLEPDNLALYSKHIRLTYGEFDSRTNRIADSLYREGVRQGDRVAMLMLNSVEFMEVLFGCAKLGAIAVPMNFRLTAAEVAYLLADSGSALLVVSDKLEPVAAEAVSMEGVRVRRRWVVGHAGVLSPGVAPYEELVAGGRDEVRDEAVGLDDIAVLMYTSGTTGRPKGAMLSHGNMTWNAVNMLGRAPGISYRDRTVTAAPMFHIGGLGVFTLPLFYVGGANYIQDVFVPTETLALMASERATGMFLVPAMWAALTQVKDFESYDLSNLRFGVSGGAPCPITVIEFMQDKGVTFQEGFGMTETAPLVSVLAAEDLPARAGSIGRVAMHVDARIVDDQDRDMPVDQVGELVLQGPNIFEGYWGLPAATAEAFRNGWFHTGDLGRMDAEGFITLVDRKKDMIITGGENVYPIEVEQVLFRHPQVADVAVIGAQDERWGEKVMAVVVPKPGENPTEQEIIEYARANMAHFKAPARVEFIAELPRNATGKILKRDLRVKFSGRAESLGR